MTPTVQELIDSIKLLEQRADQAGLKFEKLPRRPTPTVCQMVAYCERLEAITNPIGTFLAKRAAQSAQPAKVAQPAPAPAKEMTVADHQAVMMSMHPLERSRYAAYAFSERGKLRANLSPYRSCEEIAKAYHRIEDPGARTEFYRENRAAMNIAYAMERISTK